MHQDDDLRGLSNHADFISAVSLLFFAVHLYWFCYGTLAEAG